MRRAQGGVTIDICQSLPIHLPQVASEIYFIHRLTFPLLDFEIFAELPK